MLEIFCEFEGNEEGVSDVIFPPTEGRLDEVALECLSLDSQIEDTDHPEVKRIFHRPGESIQICYTVMAERGGDLPEPDRPILQDDYFLFFGYNLFPRPDGDDQKEMKIRVEWSGFPQDWRIANSYGLDELVQEFEQPLWLFLNGIYGGGSCNVIRCSDSAHPIFVGFFGTISFSQERLVSLIEQVISCQRRFWEDDDFPYTFVAIHPHSDPESIAGQGTSNGFVVFIKEFPEEKDLSFVLSHECFHTWNSTKMVPALTDGSMAWFVEGFTDYYAAKLLFQCGLFDREDVLAVFQDASSRCSTSPVRNVNNERIVQDFWNDDHVQKLAYDRGCLLAFRWDAALEEQGKSLDEMMRSLFHRTKLEKRRYLLEDIIELTGLQGATEDIERYILSGETITWHGNQKTSCEPN